MDASHGVPSPGQLCTVRQRRFVVTRVKPQALPVQPGRTAQHLVDLLSIDDDGLGERLSVVWELELGRMVFSSDAFPDPRRALQRNGAFDDPHRLDAFLHAVRWGAVASADVESLHAPFRSGITIEDYQLDPVARAIAMPRANLLIADDVGLGKTIEAGLVAQELILRHRVRTVLVVCPAGLQIQWRDQMRDRFGLEFRIVDSEAMRELRRRRGLGVNPWTHFPRLITSVDYVKRDRPMRLFREVLPPPERAFPRRFDLLIVDEAHNVAPSGRGAVSIDSQRTEAIRELAPHFEHKLFLSATPHNGYPESFTALLELLDDQRFNRGAPPSQAQLGAVMIRRLKRELPPDDLGKPRFPPRTLEALPVDFNARERAVHEGLVRYTSLLEKRAKEEGARFATDFVTKLLKKRLFSSPDAFRITLEKHRQTLEGSGTKADPSRRPSIGILRREIDGLDDDEAELENDERLDGALSAAAPLFGAPTDAELAVLDELAAEAEVLSGSADSKAQALLTFLEQTCRTKGLQGTKAWNDTRVIVFTEYRATQNWLFERMVAAGLGDEGRVELLYGGMRTDEREALKAAFQSSPKDAPVRILLATDAASEGIDLQNHCSRLVHYEIPWNPMRMEQRNGRVDRHGQRNEVRVFHFVGEGWKETGPVTDPGSLDGDLEFLFRAARKVEQVREDLGSAGDVIALQIEEAMLGKRRAMDAEVVGPKGKAAREALKIERDLREHVERLRRDLFASKSALHISPESLRAAVDVGLDLAGHPLLTPVRVESEEHGPLNAFEVPVLSGTWAPCLEGLAHPHKHDQRPIVFDHDAVRGRDDVVLCHLGHKLVTMCLSLLRAEVWMPETERKLARIAARVVPTSFFAQVGVSPHPLLAAHARLVLLAKDGTRLHEELLVVAGSIEAGKLIPLDAEVARRLVEQKPGDAARAPGRETLARLAELWPSHEPILAKEIERARKARVKAALKKLAEREKKEVAHVRVILGELRDTLARRVGELGDQQLDLFTSREREQLEKNADAVRSRLDTIPADIEREAAAIVARYQSPEDRLFPVALSYFVPSSIGGGS